MNECNISVARDAHLSSSPPSSAQPPPSVSSQWRGEPGLPSPGQSFLPGASSCSVPWPFASQSPL